MSKLTSKVSYVKKGSNSLKVIIPSSIAQLFEIQHGDEVSWSIEFLGNEKVIVIKKN